MREQKKKYKSSNKKYIAVVSAYNVDSFSGKLKLKRIYRCELYKVLILRVAFFDLGCKFHLVAAVIGLVHWSTAYILINLCAVCQWLI